MNKIAFFLITLIALLGLQSCTDDSPAKIPAPTEYQHMKKCRKERKKKRKEWIESMHRTAPGVNWRIIDRETKRIKTEKRLARKNDLLDSGYFKNAVEINEAIKSLLPLGEG